MGGSGKWVKALIGLKKPDKEDNVRSSFTKKKKKEQKTFLFYMCPEIVYVVLYLFFFRKNQLGRARSGGCGGARRRTWGLRGRASKGPTERLPRALILPGSLMLSRPPWPRWSERLRGTSGLSDKNGLPLESRPLFVDSW